MVNALLILLELRVSGESPQTRSETSQDFPFGIAWNHTRLGMLPIVATCSGPVSNAREIAFIFSPATPYPGFWEDALSFSGETARSWKLIIANLRQCSQPPVEPDVSKVPEAINTSG
jgi:hypothetical protein